MSPDTVPPAPTGPEPVNCLFCQGEFIPQPRQVYCSPRCKSAFHRRPPAEPQDHTCPAYQGTFTANPRIRQVYCSPACRHRAAKQRDDQRNEQRAARLGETPPTRPELPPPPKAVTRPGRQLSAERDPLEPTATRDCPHCRQPVTIVALLATPEAARPAMPAGPDVIPLRRTP